MFYKKWPYWLKGGIIMVITMAVLIVLLYGFIYWFIPKYPVNDIFVLITFLPLVPGAILASLVTLGGCFNMDGPCSIKGAALIFTMIALNAVAYFIVGAAIGLIYGKIKNKK